MELIQWHELAPVYNSQSKVLSGTVGSPTRTVYVPDPIKNRMSYEYPYNLASEPDPSENRDDFEFMAHKKVVEPLTNPITGKPTPPFKPKKSGGGGGSPNGPGLGEAAWLPSNHPRAKPWSTTNRGGAQHEI